MQIEKTIAIPIATDPADATVSASVVEGSSIGSADLSLSGNTLSVTGTGYGAVTIRVDAVKEGYTAASTTFTVTVQEKPVVTIQSIANQTVQVGKTIAITVTTDPADATVSAAVVAESSQGQADLSLSSNTLSVTGTVYGAVTIKVDAVKEGYTAASTTFSVDVQKKPPYGQITTPDDGDTLSEQTCIEGTTNGQGHTVTGGGVFIHNDTLNKWVRPIYSRTDGALNGKDYVDTRDDCLIAFTDDSVSGAVYSSWSIGNLAGLSLPNGQAYTIYLRVVVDGLGIQEDQDAVSVNYEELSGISVDNSLWSTEDTTHGVAQFCLGICDQDDILIAELNPDQFTVVVDNGETPVSFAQLPFGGFAYDDDGYYATYIGSGTHTFANLKVGGIPISYYDGEEFASSATVEISGGLTLSGTVTDQNSQLLAGVKVSVAGSGYTGEAFNYTFTDSNGVYSLAIPGNCPLRIVFYKQGYSCDYQPLNTSSDYSLSAVMTVDNDAPTGITVSRYNSFTNSITLTVAGGPLTDRSWQDIFALINANTAYSDGEWMNAPGLWIDYISSDGNSMVLGTDGTATIKQDFIIPADLVVDRAGHPAAKGITIDSYLGWWTEVASGLPANAGALSLTFADGVPVLACGGVASGPATVKKYLGGPWSSLGNPSLGAVQEIGYKYKDGYLNCYYHKFNYCAYVSGNVVTTASYENGAWEAVGGSNGSGESARLLQFTVDHFIYDEGTPSPLVVFEDRYTDGSGTKYRGVARLYNSSQWLPAVSTGGVEQYFNEGDSDSPLQALSMSDAGGSSLYIAYIDGAGQIEVTKWQYDTTEGHYTNYNTWNKLSNITVSGTVRPECGVAVALDSEYNPYIAYADDEGLALALYSGGSWTQLSRPGVSPGHNPIRLCIDTENDEPYICFTDADNRLTVMKYAGSDWQVVGEEGFAAIKPGELQMCVYGNMPYVAYLDANNQAHVVKYSMP